MKNWVFYFLFTISPLPYLGGQSNPNIVINGSFEIWEHESLFAVEVLAQSPDFFKNRVKLKPAYYYESDFSSHFPLNGSLGDHYAGLSSNIAGTEAFALLLSQPLERQKKYIISFDIYKPDLYTEDLSDSHPYQLTNDIPLPVGQFQYKAKGHLHYMSLLDFEINKWSKLKDTITARGNEKYLILSGPKSTHLEESYYYLYDNISIIEYQTKDDSKSKVADLDLQVFFQSGQYQMTPSTKNKLDKIINHIQTLAIDKITIEGFADGIGDAKSNRLLSHKRTENVAQYLKTFSPALKVDFINHGERLSKDDSDDPHKRSVIIIIPD